MDKILTVTDVAEILKVKEITVREMFREKRIRAFKMGKAWRTTESMLQEDIAAFSRGEAPAVIPEPVSANPGPGADAAPKKVRKPRQAAETPAAEPKPAKKEKAEKEKPEKEKPEITQQLLF